MENLQATIRQPRAEKDLDYAKQHLGCVRSCAISRYQRKGSVPPVAHKKIPFKQWGGRVWLQRARLLDVLRDLDGSLLTKRSSGGGGRPKSDASETRTHAKAAGGEGPDSYKQPNQVKTRRPANFRASGAAGAFDCGRCRC